MKRVHSGRDDTIDMLARFLSGDTTMLRCSVCGAQAGTCDCWTKCAVPGCKWSYRKGTRCDNPEHRR